MGKTKQPLLPGMADFREQGMHVTCNPSSARVVSQKLLTTAILVLATASAAKPPHQSAVEELRDLQTKLHETHLKNDWRSNLENAQKQKQLLNESPDSLLEVARAEEHVGDTAAAFRELKRFVTMGQSAELLETSADFASMRANDQYAEIRDGMKANESPISNASTAFSLSNSTLLTEDLDFGPTTSGFLITSIRGKKVVWADAHGSLSEFASAPDKWPMVAIKIDRKRGLVWATEVAFDGFASVPKADWGRSALLCFDLKSAKLLRRIEGPRGSQLGDMTLAANGDIVVSDGLGGGVYRLPASGESLQRLDNGDFISPQTPAMHPDGKHIFVPDYLRGIGVLDCTTRQVRWLSMEGKFALNGIDGLYLAGDKLIAVQNGTSPERVVVFTLDATLTRIRSEAIIERSTVTLGDPTHGVVIGDDFFYIANSGWDILDEQGNVKPNTKPSVPRVMLAELGKLKA